jgi:hypothetical protein
MKSFGDVKFNLKYPNNICFSLEEIRRNILNKICCFVIKKTLSRVSEILIWLFLIYNL